MSEQQKLPFSEVEGELAQRIWGGVPQNFPQMLQELKKSPEAVIKRAEFLESVFLHPEMQKLRVEIREQVFNEWATSDAANAAQRESLYHLIRGIMTFDEIQANYINMGKFATAIANRPKVVEV